MFIALIYLIHKEMQKKTMRVPDLRTSISTLDNRKGTLLLKCNSFMNLTLNIKPTAVSHDL